MSFKANFTAQDVRKAVQAKADALDAAVLSGLQRVGERFIANARNKGTYTDRTGNLRASIGYVILRNGTQVSGSFPGAATAGKAAGQEKARQVAAGFPKGYVLIGVAGMAYAAAVEAKGKDVISASVIIAGQDLNALMERIKNKLK